MSIVQCDVRSKNTCHKNTAKKSDTKSGCSAVRVAHMNGVHGVAGSNPVIPTSFYSHEKAQKTQDETLRMVSNRDELLA